MAEFLSVIDLFPAGPVATAIILFISDKLAKRSLRSIGTLLHLFSGRAFSRRRISHKFSCSGPTALMFDLLMALSDF